VPDLAREVDDLNASNKAKTIECQQYIAEISYPAKTIEVQSPIAHCSKLHTTLL